MATAEPSGALRSGLATVTVGTLFLIVATLCLVTFNFFARVLIVRSVSEADWDAFSLGFTLTQVLLAVGSLGIPVAVARSLPNAASDLERRTIVRTALVYGGAAAAASGVALALAAPFVGADLASPALAFGLELFALALSCLTVGTLLAALFQGFANVTPNALYLQILNPGLFVGLLAIALVVPPGRVTFGDALVAYALSHAITLLALVAYTRAKLPHGLVRGPIDPAVRSRLLRLAVPLLVFGAMFTVAGTGDTVVLGFYHYGEVGAYTASLTLARLVQVGIAAASYIFLPVASQFLARGNRRAVRLTYTTVTKWLTVFSLPLFLLFVFLPSGSLSFVYGARYAGVVAPLQITVIGAFAGTLLGPAGMAQVAAGQARLLAVNAAVAGIADVVLAFVLVPPYGQVGAGFAWAIANLVYVSLCLSELAWTERLHPFARDFVVPLAATTVPLGFVLAVLPVRVPLLALPALGIVFAFVFVGVVILTRSVDEGDRLLLHSVEGLLGFPVPLVRRLASFAVRVRAGAGPAGRDGGEAAPAPEPAPGDRRP